MMLKLRKQYKKKVEMMVENKVKEGEVVVLEIKDCFPEKEDGHKDKNLF